jgi:D-glycero-alpha-D-manno-heptose 1-phosphate guanylyltransferase
MRSILGERPKALTPIGERPFLAYVLERLFERPGTSVHLCLGYKADSILAAIGSHGLRRRVTHTVEHEPLGVSGALRLAEAFLEREFVLLYGDVWPDVNVARLLRRHAEAGMPATMAIAPVMFGEGNVGVRDGRITRYVKQAGPGDRDLTHYEDAGMTVLSRYLMRRLPPVGQPAGEQELFGPIAEEGLLAAARLSHRSLHVGDPTAYRRVVDALGPQVGGRRWRCSQPH